MECNFQGSSNLGVGLVQGVDGCKMASESGNFDLQGTASSSESTIAVWDLGLSSGKMHNGNLDVSSQSFEVQGLSEDFHSYIGKTVKLNHDRFSALVPWLDLVVDKAPITSVSEWVLQKIAEVSEALGMFFDGLEHMSWDLFAELEKRALIRPGKEIGGRRSNGGRIS